MTIQEVPIGEYYTAGTVNESDPNISAWIDKAADREDTIYILKRYRAMLFLLVNITEAG